MYYGLTSGHYSCTFTQVFMPNWNFEYTKDVTVRFGKNGRWCGPRSCNWGDHQPPYRLLTQRVWRRTTMILFQTLSGCFNVHLIIFVTSMALYTLTDKTIRASIFGEITTSACQHEGAHLQPQWSDKAHCKCSSVCSTSVILRGSCEEVNLKGTSTWESAGLNHNVLMAGPSQHPWGSALYELIEILILSRQASNFLWLHLLRMRLLFCGSNNDWWQKRCDLCKTELTVDWVLVT